MAIQRVGSRLMLFQKGQTQLSGIQHTLRSVAGGHASPMEANIESQTRLKKMVTGGSSMSISQHQSSHGLGVGCGAAVMEAIEWDNKLLNWSFGGLGKELDGVLLARGKEPVSEDEDDDDDYDEEFDFDDDEDLLDDDEDDLDDVDTVEVKKGSRGTK